MFQHTRRVQLVEDMDHLLGEDDPHMVFLVRPMIRRKYAHQRTPVIAEMVDLTTLNLAKMTAFETR